MCDESATKKVFRRVIDSRTSPETMLSTHTMVCGHKVTVDNICGDLLETEMEGNTELVRCQECEEARAKRMTASEASMFIKAEAKLKAWRKIIDPLAKPRNKQVEEIVREICAELKLRSDMPGHTSTAIVLKFTKLPDGGWRLT